MTCLTEFVGVPFADHGRTGGFDCWGLARSALLSCRGITLPDYGDGYAHMADHAGISATIRDGLAQGWVRVADPRAFDLVIFNIAGQPRHVGLMVGPSKFLHCPEPTVLPGGRITGGTSRIERTEDRMWQKRIEGFYRYAD